MEPSTDIPSPADTAQVTPEPQDASAVPEEREPMASGVPPRLSSPPGSPPVGGTPDRYDYDKTTIVLVAQLRPVKEEGQSREVWLSVQNGVGNEYDSPLWRVCPEAEIGAWPPVIAQLLSALRDDLPTRQLRYEQKRVTTPTVVPSLPTAASKRAALPAPKAAEKRAVVPPPVPTTSSPIPKQELAMSGLFDGLE